jgi:hypothetical protein
MQPDEMVMQYVRAKIKSFEEKYGKTCPARDFLKEFKRTKEIQS